MKHSNLTFRSLKADDLPWLIELVSQTWSYKTWVPEELVTPMAEYFLTDQLARSTTNTIALQNDKPVGIIAYSTKTESTLQQLIAKQQVTSLQQILYSLAPKNVFTKFIETMALDEQLLRQQNRHYYGAINLLIVHPDFAGQQIGSKLYQTFLTQMKKQQHKTFYLFTDSNSDYHFYEHKGLQRVAEQNYYWEAEAETESYYLYEGTIND